MGEEEVQEIGSLGQLLIYAKQNDFSHKKYFFRGEAMLYERRNSSAYRKPSQMTPFSVSSLLSDYYREVGHNLNSSEAENFLAYSQHHGLATNLIDITDSILIATFFASQKTSGVQDTAGYIYCYDASKCLYLPPNTVPEDNLMLFNNLFQLNKSTIEVLFHMFNDYYSNFDNFRSIYDTYLLLLKDNICSEDKYILQEIQGEIDKFRCSKVTYMSYTEGDRPQEVENLYIMSLFELSERIVDVLENNNNYQRYVEEIREVGLSLKLRWVRNDPVNIITSLILIFIALMRNDSGNVQDFYNNLPPIIYRSKIKFDRIRSQSGSFIFQNNHQEYRGTASEILRYHPQNIVEHKKIQITNKEEIIKELDDIGINEVFIYGDSDNIAQYMMNKYR